MSSTVIVMWWVLSIVALAVLAGIGGITWHRFRKRDPRTVSERRNEVIRALFTVLRRPALDATDISFFQLEPQITRDVTIVLGELSLRDQREKFTELAIQSGFASWLSSEARWGSRRARLLALRALTFITGDVSTAALRAALGERNSEIRQVAITALDDRGQLASVPGLIGLIAASLDSGRSFRLSDLFHRRAAGDRQDVSPEEDYYGMPVVQPSQSESVDKIAV